MLLFHFLDRISGRNPHFLNLTIFLIKDLLLQDFIAFLQCAQILCISADSICHCSYLLAKLLLFLELLLYQRESQGANIFVCNGFIYSVELTFEFAKVLARRGTLAHAVLDSPLYLLQI